MDGGIFKGIVHGILSDLTEINPNNIAEIIFNSIAEGIFKEYNLKEFKKIQFLKCFLFLLFCRSVVMYT